MKESADWARNPLLDYHREFSSGHQEAALHRAHCTSSEGLRFVALGDFDESLGCLEKEYRERGNFLTFINIDPWLAPLRPHPPFKRLLASLRFPVTKAIQVNNL